MFRQLQDLVLHVRRSTRNYDANYAHIREVKEAFLKGIATIEGTHINGCVGEDSAPHIVSVSFEEIDKSEALLHALEDPWHLCIRGVACSSNKPAVSATLKAIVCQRQC